MSESDAGASQPTSLSEALSGETRTGLRELATALAAGQRLEKVRPWIGAAAKSCVGDCRLRSARAEQLVVALKAEWFSCADAIGVPRQLAADALEELVTASIREFYGASRT